MQIAFDLSDTEAAFRRRLLTTNGCKPLRAAQHRCCRRYFYWKLLLPLQLMPLQALPLLLLILLRVSLDPTVFATANVAPPAAGQRKIHPTGD
jgi:hypothetical protein